MNKTTIFIIAVVIIAGVWFFLSKESTKMTEDTIRAEDMNDSEEEMLDLMSKNEFGFTNISSTELNSMLENKDFTMVDVHIPEQQHIPGTDYMIPYNEVDKIVSAIPDKNAKIVLYCRSGNMSKQTASDLVEVGYTNVFELEYGLNEWLTEKREVLPKGSVDII